jgi:hypothetical protein
VVIEGRPRLVRLPIGVILTVPGRALMEVPPGPVGWRRGLGTGGYKLVLTM